MRVGRVKGRGREDKKSVVVGLGLIEGVLREGEVVKY